MTFECRGTRLGELGFTQRDVLHSKWSLTLRGISLWVSRAPSVHARLVGLFCRSCRYLGTIQTCCVAELRRRSRRWGVFRLSCGSVRDCARQPPARTLWDSVECYCTLILHRGTVYNSTHDSLRANVNGRSIMRSRCSINDVHLC